MLARIPRWFGTTLIVGGLIGCAVCYVATGVALRREQACADLQASAALTAQCVSDASSWADISIAGFVTALLVGFAGVVIDRLQGWMLGASRRAGRPID